MYRPTSPSPIASSENSGTILPASGKKVCGEANQKRPTRGEATVFIEPSGTCFSIVGIIGQSYSTEILSARATAQGVSTDANSRKAPSRRRYAA